MCQWHVMQPHMARWNRTAKPSQGANTPTCRAWAGELQLLQKSEDSLPVANPLASSLGGLCTGGLGMVQRLQLWLAALPKWSLELHWGRVLDLDCRLLG